MEINNNAEYNPIIRDEIIPRKYKENLLNLLINTNETEYSIKRLFNKRCFDKCADSKIQIKPEYAS